jgi:hypothetical protein
MSRNLAAIMRMLGSSSSREAVGSNRDPEEVENQPDPETLNMSRIVRQIYLSR